MGRAGNGVFGHATVGTKKARYEIAFIAPRGDYDAAKVILGKASCIRCRIGDGLLAFELYEQILPPSALVNYFASECRLKARLGRLLELLNGKVQLVVIRPGSSNHQLATGAAEPDICPGNALLAKQDMARGEGGVAAEADFHRRCEPADLPIAVTRNHKRGFRQVILLRHLAEPRFGRPVWQQAHGGWIA